MCLSRECRVLFAQVTSSMCTRNHKTDFLPVDLAFSLEALSHSGNELEKRCFTISWLGGRKTPVEYKVRHVAFFSDRWNNGR
jgi:hypothetical protein